MRVVLVLGLLATVAVTPVTAHAGDQRGWRQPLPDRELTRADKRLPDFARPDTFRQREGRIVIVPQIVFVSPGRCWQAGYWTYQWVPQAYSYTTWVPAQWSPDGAWIEGHYAAGWYSGGYYQPLWIDEYWSRC